MRRSTCLLAIITLVTGALGVACTGTSSSSSGAGEGAGTGADGGAGSSGSSGSSGASGGAAAALPLSTFLFVSTATVGHDVLVAYDVESGEARTVTDLRGDGSEGWSINGYGLSPDRTRVALSSRYGPTKEDTDTGLATQRIWTAAVDGTDFRRLTPVFPNTAGGRKQFMIDLRNPVFSKDGADVVYSYGEFYYEGAALRGGSGLWSVKAAGGSLPSYLETAASCSVVNPSVDPKTGKLLAIHSVCSGSQDGLYLYSADGSGTPEKLLGSDYSTIDVALETPSWVADGSGFVFVGTTASMIDGLSLRVTGLFAFDMSTRKATALVVPDKADTGVRSATLAPDGRAIVYCLRTGEANDLHIIDLTKDQATDAALTNDGKSCRPVW